MRPLLLALLVAGAAPVTAQRASSPYVVSDCPNAEDAAGVECGRLAVPERWGDPASPEIGLAVARVPSLSPTPAPDPVVFLNGGPGFGAVRLIRSALAHPFWRAVRAERDLILVDVRGTGASDPAFCPAENRAIAAALSRGGAAAPTEAAVADALRACRARMAAAGHDVAAYTSAAVARDLDALRHALGVAEWNLLGVSYGSRLALTALRDTPGGIRSAVLLAPAVPNAPVAYSPARYTRTLGLVFERCAADRACRAAYPDLQDDFYRALAALEREPVRLAMADTARFPGGQVVLDGTLLAASVYQGLYGRPFVEVFPLAVRAVLARDERALRTMAEGIGVGPDVFNRPLNYAMTCFDAAPHLGAAEAERPDYPRLAPWYDQPRERALCDAIHDARGDSAEARAVRSDVPMLALVGALDPVTPPAYARLAVAGLANGTVVEVPHHSHHVVLSEDAGCAVGLVRAFLDAPGRPLDTRCLADVPPLAFVTDVTPASGVGRVASALSRRPALLLPVGLAVLVLLSAVVGWPVAALRRRGADGPRGPRWVAGAAATAALVWVGGLGAAVAQAAAVNPYLLAFGLPGDAAWLLVLPWLTAALAAGAVGLAIVAWRRRWWTAMWRAHYALVAAASGTVVAVAAMAGLL
ncbi:alpha/beta fold hydrolase [Rubrivirga sp. IMCC43871]|uniref:alpha/beta fold hydrolase n=1 Tax=Rubrivirga sp. IMCC43871 TaxID=3391575 RepID=UPI00398FFAB4